MDSDIKREFERLNKKLNDLVAGQKKESWITATWVASLTGWDKHKLDQARKQKIIEFKRSDTGGWLYKLESIPEQFIKKQTA